MLSRPAGLGFDILPKPASTPAGKPLEKLERVRAVKGFGVNSASELVMVMHPDGLTLQNKPSEQALRALGYQFESAEQFQEAAADLREALGLRQRALAILT